MRLFLLAFVLLLLGCERETLPPLIEVKDVSPHELEEGDRLTLHGGGFPEGKMARVTFRGDLHRPGSEVVSGVTLELEALATSSSEVEIPVTSSTIGLFAGPGDYASHTTFSGDVTVAFAARAAAAPPVAGTLSDVWVDVQPPAQQRSSTEEHEAERTLGFLGVHPDLAPLASGGVRVISVDPHSRADEARLLAEDVITEWDGVRVLSMKDLVTVPGAADAWLKIRRNGSSHEDVARLSLAGFRPPPAAALRTPVIILGLAGLVLLFFVEVPTAIRIRLYALSRSARRLSSPGLGVLARGARSSLSFVLAASLALTVLPLAHIVGLADVDATNLFVLSVTALASLALLTSARTSARARAVARVLSLSLPVAATLVGAVLLTGSLRIGDLVRSQSGWPWGWTVFKTPPTLLLCLLSLAAVHAGSPAPTGLPDSRARLFRHAWHIYVLILSALGAALFLGGWQIPGLPRERADGHLGWTALGALLYLTKTWFLTVGSLGLAALLPPLREKQAMRRAWRRLVPLSLFALLLLFAWCTWGPRPTAEATFGSLLFAMAAGTSLYVAVRVRRYAVSPPMELDPFV